MSLANPVVLKVVAGMKDTWQQLAPEENDSLPLTRRRKLALIEFETTEYSQAAKLNICWFGWTQGLLLRHISNM